MTTLPTLNPNHAPTAAELGTITTAITRSIPIKGINITNTGNPINTTSGTTELDLSKYAMTGLTLVTGRYYLLRVLVTYTKSVSTDAFDLNLRANTAVSGTQVGKQQLFAADLAIGNREFQFLFKGDSSYTALYVSAVRSAGTGTLSYFGAAGGGLNRAYAILCDHGDSDNWSDVA